MALNLDDEILQDFLVEAGEILETLSEQLVELEAKPKDTELLNAIFRGFHTVKGGAGFLALHHLVAVCHIAENVFDMLRKGERKVDSALMDVILRTLDEVNRMFGQIREGTDPEAAPQKILDDLNTLVHAPQAAPVVQAPAPTVTVEVKPASINIQAEIPSPSVANPNDEMSADEFERLLDALHPNTASAAPITNVGTPSPPPPLPDIAPPKVEEIIPSVTPMHDHDRDDVQDAKKPTDDAFKAGRDHKDASAETTVRVDTSRLDEIMNMVGELVLVRNRLVKIKDSTHDEELSKAVGHLDIVTGDLQMAVMKTRMQPIKKVFGRFPRVVRDLARSLDKDVVLEMIGEDTDLDKNLVEALSDPLVHLVRNSVDHGIESRAERKTTPKAPTGKILLSAEQAGDHILLSITDDGRGMDPELLRRKAVEKKIMEPDVAARLSIKECFDIIFLPGFSTKDQITDISGRGVGMDVVKTKISQLNGSVEIESHLGRGTKINIKVPLTLAILPTLMVMVANQTFALPLTNVNEIFHLDMSKTHVVDGQRVVVVRDKSLPLFHLRDWLARSNLLSTKLADDFYKTQVAHVVIVTIGTQRIGFIVDGLVGQEEVVIKALGDMLQGTLGMAGATITGDGKIAMILDVPGLLKRYASRHRA